MASDGDRAGAGGTRLVRELYFPTFIHFLDLAGAAALNASLKEAIYALKAENAEGLHRSNVKQAGAWHSENDLHRLPAFAALTDEIRAAATEAFRDLRYDPRYEPLIDNMWANVSPRNAFNRTHVHPGVIMSGVYYVQAPPDSGRIYFSDPRVQAQMLRPFIDDAGRGESHNWTEVYFEPIEGRLLLFPSWLTHEVEPNLSAENGDAGHRISISFNLVQRRRDG